MQTDQFGDPRVLVAVIFSLALIIAVWMWHDIEKQKFNAGLLSLGCVGGIVTGIILTRMTRS